LQRITPVSGGSLRNKLVAVEKLRLEIGQMTAYEFYSRDESGELHLIGVLPERRSNQERITDESIIRWARSLFGDESGVNNISYSTIRLEKRNDGIFYAIPISQKEL
jgi:hypothetical protein